MNRVSLRVRFRAVTVQRPVVPGVLTALAVVVTGLLCKTSGNWYLAHTGVHFVIVVGVTLTLIGAFGNRLARGMNASATSVAIVGVALPVMMFQSLSNPLVTTSDTLPTLPTVVQMLRHGNRDLSAYLHSPGHPRWHAGSAYSVRRVNGQPGLYSSYPAGMEVVALPAVLLGMALNLDLDDDAVLWRLERGTAACLGGATLAIFYLIARKRSTPAAAYAMTLLLATGSPLASTTGLALWQQAGTVFWMMVVMAVEVYRPRGTVLWQALALAMLIACRPAAGLFVLCFAAWLLLTDWRRGLETATLALVCYLPWALLYSHIYGSPFGPSMTMMNEAWSVAGNLSGVLVSPGRGLFAYQPWIVVFVLALSLKRRERPNHSDTEAHRRSTNDRTGFCSPPTLCTSVAAVWSLLIFVSLHTLLIASWPTWWGGHGYGSRLMAEVVPILAMLLLPALQSLLNRRWGTMLISGLVILNLALHLPGSHGTAAAWNFAPADVDTHPERLWDWQHPPFLEDIQNPK